MKKLFPHILALVILFSAGHSVVFAQVTTCDSATGNGCSAATSNQGTPSTIGNPFNCGGATNCTLDVFLNNIIHNLVLPLGGVLAVLAFIWVGFMYVTARGNSTKLEEANRALLYVAIGTAVLLGAELLSSVISNTVNKL
jgi:type IV secretory pathway VirB2 component (pilin)